MSFNPWGPWTLGEIKTPEKGDPYRIIKEGAMGRVPAHAHLNLLDEWELCTDNDCEVYQTAYAQTEKEG